MRACELCAGLGWKIRRVLAGSWRPRCPAGWAGLPLSESNRRTAASGAGGTARMILVGRPSLCRWRIWVIAAMCVASFAAPRARAAPAGGLAVAGGDPPPGAAEGGEAVSGDGSGHAGDITITVAAVFLTLEHRSAFPTCAVQRAFRHSNRLLHKEIADSQDPAPGRHSQVRRCTRSPGRGL